MTGQFAEFAAEWFAAGRPWCSRCRNPVVQSAGEVVHVMGYDEYGAWAEVYDPTHQADLAEWQARPAEASGFPPGWPPR